MEDIKVREDRYYAHLWTNEKILDTYLPLELFRNWEEEKFRIKEKLMLKASN